MCKVEQFFEIDSTRDDIKVNLASMHIEGKALHWYKAFLSTRDKEKVFLWEEFVDILMARFREQVVWDPIVELKKLRQDGFVQQYLEDFDIMLSKTNFIEGQAIYHFLGIKGIIRNVCAFIQANYSNKAYVIAKKQEILWKKKGSGIQDSRNLNNGNRFQ